MVIVYYFLKLLVLGTQVVLFKFENSDMDSPIWDKHNRKSSIFLRVTQIFRYKNAQIRSLCAQKSFFVHIFLGG